MNNNIITSFELLSKVLLRKKSVHLSENHLVLSVQGISCTDQAKLEILKSFAREIGKKKLGELIFSGEILKDIDLLHASIEDVENDTWKLVLKKSKRKRYFFFFTLEGFTKALDDKGFLNTAKRVWVAGDFYPFSTITTDFVPWDSRSPSKPFEWGGMADPRKLVRDLTVSEDDHIPTDIRPWLLRPNRETKSSKQFDIWKIKAAKILSLTLPNEIRFSDNRKKISFKGEKLREADFKELSKEEYLELFPVLFEAAEWLYSNMQDAEIKHTLFNFQLASEWVVENTWPDMEVIRRALASAREAYKLHLQGSNRDLLKAYEEIKSSLQGEVNKFAENTRGLVSNFWRDFTIAAAVLVFNFATSTSDLSSTGIRILYPAAAGFLLVSLFITIITNARFNRITQDNRNAWREKLYPFIDDDKYNDLVNKPIENGLVTYNITVFITTIIYLVMAAYLIKISLNTP